MNNIDLKNNMASCDYQQPLSATSISSNMLLKSQDHFQLKKKYNFEQNKQNHLKQQAEHLKKELNKISEKFDEDSIQLQNKKQKLIDKISKLRAEKKQAFQKCLQLSQKIENQKNDFEQKQEKLILKQLSFPVDKKNNSLKQCYQKAKLQRSKETLVELMEENENLKQRQKSEKQAIAKLNKTLNNVNQKIIGSSYPSKIRCNLQGWVHLQNLLELIKQRVNSEKVTKLRNGNIICEWVKTLPSK